MRRVRPPSWMLPVLLILPLAGAKAQPDVAATADPPIAALQLVADGFAAPVDLAAPADGSGRLFVVDQVGLIHVVTTTNGRLERPFLDLRGRIVPLLQGFDERGLIGFALHPDYPEDGRFYVAYTAPLPENAPDAWDHAFRVSEFSVAAEDPNRANPGSERVLLEIPWPSRKHNGGGLAFGADGYLFIGAGDGGGVHGLGEEGLYEAFDIPEERAEWDRFAQDVRSLYGSILRIDVDRGFPGYAVPELNPFVGKPGRDEIYAWGFRNPYRLAFDGGAFFVTAPGETLWEAIYLVDEPGNYGWPIREGRHCFDRRRPEAPPSACASTGPLGEPLVDPIIEYANMSIQREGVAIEGRGVGTAVVGGQIYRGRAIPALHGKLVFGDWSRTFETPSGQIFVASPPSAWAASWPWRKLLQLDSRVLGVGRDNDGELYVLASDALGPFGDTGKVYRLVAAGR